MRIPPSQAALILGVDTGTGKSTRMQDCYGTMGITSSNELVVADGDSIRETHAVSDPLDLSGCLF